MGLCHGKSPPSYKKLYPDTDSLECFRDFHRKHFNMDLVNVLQDFYNRVNGPDSNQLSTSVAIQEEFSASVIDVIYKDPVLLEFIKNEPIFVMPQELSLNYKKNALGLYLLFGKLMSHIHDSKC